MKMHVGHTKHKHTKYRCSQHCTTNMDKGIQYLQSTHLITYIAVGTFKKTFEGIPSSHTIKINLHSTYKNSDKVLHTEIEESLKSSKQKENHKGINNDNEKQAEAA